MYLRLVDEKQADWKNRSHFLALAAKNMRQILVQHARTRNAKKRGGARQRIPLAEGLGAAGRKPVDFCDIDAALRELESFNARMGEIVEMRFLGGMSVNEVAEVPKVDPRTVKRDWRVARLFLLDRLSGARDGGEPEESP